MSGGLGVVFSGGGAPAAYFGAGVVQALEEHALEPRVLSGVSAGALTASALGVGMNAAALADLWRDVAWCDVFTPRVDVWNAIDLGGLCQSRTNVVEYLLGSIGWTWLLDTAPLHRTLVRHVGGEELTVRPEVTLVISAVEARTASVVRFCNRKPRDRRAATSEFREGPLRVEHLMASTAVPMLFPPQVSGEEVFVDAGLFANTPLLPAMAYEPEAVIVVSGSGVPRPAPEPTSLASAIALLVNNVARYALLTDYQHAETVNTLARAAPTATEKRLVPLLLIEATDLSFTATGFLGFDPDTAEAMMEYGYREALQKLEGWEYLR